MTLSILIPTLPEGYSIEMLRRLNKVLDPQIAKHSSVEKIIHDAGRSMPTGQKRNELIKQAEGDYIVQIDSDDLVTPNYIDKIMEGIGKGVDVVSFCGWMTTDGGNRKDFVIKKDERYEERNGVYYRYCNHLCAFKKSVVEHIKFPHIWVREDYEYATQIKRLGLLKTEHHITDRIYHYDFQSKKPRA